MNGVSSGKNERSKRKRILEQELGQLQEQRQAIARQLEALRGGKGLAKASSTPFLRAGSKRPGGPLDGPLGLPEGPQAKKARIETERQRRVNSLWQQCSTILKALKKGKDAQPFLVPVDPMRLGCRDYFDIIKHPMDLGTVAKKLEDKPDKMQPRMYQNVYEFRDDVRLVFSNCRTYNQVGHVVRGMGDRLSDQWEKRWQQSGLEAKWEEEMRRQKAEQLEIEGVASMPNEAVPGRIKQLAGELQAATDRVDAANLPKPSIPGPHRAMTFEEKRKLSQKLSSLNDDQLAPVLQLISENMPQTVDDGDGEIELDLDALPQDLLWKLQAHMQQLDAQQGKGPARRPPEKARPTQPVSAAGGPAGPSGADQETSSRPAAPSSAADPSALQKANSSSSSSSGDSSSSEGSDDEEVEENGGSTLMDGRAAAKAPGPLQAGGGDVTTLVSATRPPATHKLKAGNPANVSVQNVNAWTNLAASTAAPAEKPEEGAAAAADGDDLWKEFANKEEQQTAVQKAKQEAEAAQQKQREEELRAQREAAEEQQRQQQQEKQEREQAEQRRIQDLKDAEARRLEELGAPADAPEEGMPDLVHNIDNTGANPLGLTMVHNSDDDESNDSDDSE